MSSVPFYAINTSCRTVECPRSPLHAARAKTPAEGRVGLCAGAGGRTDDKIRP